MSLHKIVIAASTASLVFLGLAGTHAHADNMGADGRSSKPRDHAADTRSFRDSEDPPKGGGAKRKGWWLRLAPELPKSKV